MTTINAILALLAAVGTVLAYLAGQKQVVARLIAHVRELIADARGNPSDIPGDLQDIADDLGQLVPEAKPPAPTPEDRDIPIFRPDRPR